MCIDRYCLLLRITISYQQCVYVCVHVYTGIFCITCNRLSPTIWCIFSQDIFALLAAFWELTLKWCLCQLCCSHCHETLKFVHISCPCPHMHKCTYKCYIWFLILQYKCRRAFIIMQNMLVVWYNCSAQPFAPKRKLSSAEIWGVDLGVGVSEEEE